MGAKIKTPKKSLDQKFIIIIIIFFLTPPPQKKKKKNPMLNFRAFKIFPESVQIVI